MTRRAKKYLFDILSCIEELELLGSEVVSLENLEEMPLQKRALERLFEIIGEATRRLVEEYSDIEISNKEKIIGMRNIIAHGYDAVNYKILWQALHDQIPTLNQEAKRLLEKGG